MKHLNKLLIALLFLLPACEYEQDQIFDREKDPTAPVLSIEGVTNFEIPENQADLSDFYYSILTWTRADFGKGVSVDYVVEVADNEFFDGSTVTIEVGKDIYLRALSSTELYGWALEKYGVINEETGVKDPVDLYFRVKATEVLSAGVGRTIYSGVDMISTQWYIPGLEPLTISFKAISGDWGEYAVYAWGESEVYGGWPGEKLESQKGWYTFTVPVNRPINLIINNNGNGKQFNFLTDPEVSGCFELEIGDENNSCVWTEVECPELGYPEALYMIGDEFGSWNWESDGVVEMTPVHSFDGHFWCVRYISADKGFKWNTVRAWGGDFFSLGEDLGFTTKDGNAFVAADGFYLVYADMENGKISVEPARVYGMGVCFGGWDKETYPFTAEGNSMTCTTSGNGELRMYATSNIFPATGDWWQMEFVILDGKIAYRGGGDDQERVEVEAGKKISLNFNAGTGTIE